MCHGRTNELDNKCVRGYWLFDNGSPAGIGLSVPAYVNLSPTRKWARLTSFGLIKTEMELPLFSATIRLTRSARDSWLCSVRASVVDRTCRKSACPFESIPDMTRFLPYDCSLCTWVNPRAADTCSRALRMCSTGSCRTINMICAKARIVESSVLSKRLIWGRKYDGHDLDRRVWSTSSIKPQKNAGIWSSRDKYEFLTRSHAQKKIARSAYGRRIVRCRDSARARTDLQQ